MHNSETWETELRRLFPEAEDVRVSVHAYGGYEVRVVTKQIETGGVASAREAVFGVIPDDKIASLELLSPAEAQAQAAGEKTEQALPLWPEALANGTSSETITVNLPSEQQQSLTAPVIATFYSLRGGVGRTTALAHTAYALAAEGLSVLCMDMDLEAPGLATMLGVGDEVGEQQGVVQLLLEIDASEEPPANLEDHIIRVSDAPPNQRLSVIPAGVISPGYARKLALLEPSAWYREAVNPLTLLIDSIRELDAAVRPDVLLIDSRTGISDIAAPLLFDVSDIAVIPFYPHPQARGGTELLTRALLQRRTRREDSGGDRFTPEPRFVVSPVPEEDSSSKQIESRALDWVTEWLSAARASDGRYPFEATQELVIAVPYSKKIAVSDRAQHDETLRPYQGIAGWIGSFVDVAASAPAARGTREPLPEKSTVLEELKFIAETADEQSSAQIDEIFVGTSTVREALLETTPLVIGRKGSGKTLLFKRLLAQEASVVAVTRPSAVVAEQHDWETNADLFNGLDKVRGECGLEWPAVWRALIVLTIARTGKLDTEIRSHLPELHALAVSSRYTGRQIIEDATVLFGNENPGIYLSDLLREINDHRVDNLHLLFDGLDTGFGANTELRNSAITGLLMLLNEQLRGLSSMRCKAFIRHDIFRALSFPNKSHLRAAGVELEWSNQNDYLRIILRQARRSQKFQEYAKAQVLGRAQEGRDESALTFLLDKIPIEHWNDEVLLGVWESLVGERMSGSQTAFTRNWVWTRLADANGDRFPRHLVQLFDAALRHERARAQRDPETPTLIRPRALQDALNDVSEAAVDALNEEFPEIKPVREELARIGRTPLLIEDLDEQRVSPEALKFAQEVGLLGFWGDAHYRVPDLYRSALGVTRTGPR